MSVYLTSPSSVVQLPLSSCQRYVSCYDCIFARDPHCAWDGTQCVAITSHVNRSVFIWFGGIQAYILFTDVSGPFAQSNVKAELRRPTGPTVSMSV